MKGPMRNTLSRMGVLVLAACLSGAAFAGDKLFSPPGLPKAKEKADPDTQCVEPVEVMRRRHMEFLLHHRDEAMHKGIRTPQHSLVECIECHVEPGTDIHGKEHFCSTCHEYAAVRIDCFQCHASQPATGDGEAAKPGASGAPADDTGGHP